jgi:hypothetical protein
VSSTYRVLCLSHDPAIVAADDFQRPEQAEEAIRDGMTNGHEHCDLMIGRYSYPLVDGDGAGENLGFLAMTDMPEPTPGEQAFAILAPHLAGVPLFRSYGLPF